MDKNKVDDIITKLPINTKIYTFNIGSDGEVTSTELSNMSNVIQNDILVANIVLAGYLKSFGIDVYNIASNDIESGDNVIILLRNLLINSKWEDTNVTIEGVTKTAKDWISEKFAIYDKADFIDELYRRLVDIVYNSDGSEDGAILNTDYDTYQMIKLLAYCYMTDNDFSNITVGEESIINIPFDKEHLDRIEDFLYDYLKDNGYIDGDSLPSISFPQQLYDIFTNTPLDSDDYFQYCHIQILKSKQTNAWVIYGYFTHEEISYLETIPMYVHINGWSWNRTGFAVRCRPYTSDGVINDTNLCGFVSSNAEGQRLAGCLMNSATTPFAAANSNGYNSCYSVWCRRSDFTDPTTETHYDELCYNGNGTNGVTDTSWSGHLNGVNMPYNYSTAYGDQWRNLGYWEWSDDLWHGVWAWNWCNFTDDEPYIDDYVYDTTKADKINVLINNNHIGPATTIPSPTIDPLTLTDLDNRDLLNLNLIFMIYINKDGINALLKPSTTRVDIINILKTKLIDISLGVDIDDGKPIDEIEEDYKTIYTPYFDTGVIEYFNDGEYTMGLMPSELVAVLKGTEEINNLNDDLWDSSIWTQLTHPNYNPMDCVECIMAFPFPLKEGDDYSAEKYATTLGGVSINTQVRKLRNYTKVIETEPVFIGQTAQIKNKNGVVQKTSIVKGNFLDYAPYSNASIFIPFVGLQPLNIDLIMYRYIYLQYQVSLLSGDFIATVYSYNFNDDLTKDSKFVTQERRYKKAYPVLTCTGNMGLQFPIAGRTQANRLGQLTSMIGGIASFVGGAAIGGVGGAIMGANGAVEGLKGIVNNNEGQMVNKPSSLGGNFGWLDNWTPYVTLYKHQAISGYKSSTNTAFNETKGMMTERGIAIKNMDRGFHIVSGVKMQALPHATNQEKAEIEQILKTGFYTSSEKNKSH